MSLIDEDGRVGIAIKAGVSGSNRMTFGELEEEVGGQSSCESG